MVWRALIGLLIGSAGGACVGATGFFISASLFGRGAGLLGPSPQLAAIVGALFVGVPGAAVGAIVGGWNLGKAQGGALGAAAGLLLVALSAWRSESRYFYESGYFDRQLFFNDLFDGATLLVGLALVAVAVSASVTGPPAAGR